MDIDGTANPSPSLTERVAEEIRVVLTRRRIRQSQLARQLGVNEQWISSRLRGATPIDLNDLERIADVLEVDIVELLPRASGGRTVIPVMAGVAERGDARARYSVNNTSPGPAVRRTPKPRSQRMVRTNVRPGGPTGPANRRPVPVGRHASAMAAS